MDALSHILTLDWLQWLLTIEIAGFAALPLAMFLFRSFPDRGYGLSKPLGILAVAFVNWWLGSVASLGNYPAVLWLLVVLLALGGLALHRTGLAHGPEDLRSWLRIVAIEEALFLVAFVVWSCVRSVDPDIYSTEKPMDFMLLQVSGMTHSFPPPDAWLAGHTVNYYYLGYAIFAMIGKMAGVDPRFGYNLSNITIFALGCTAGYSLTLALTKSRLWGFAGAFALMLAGNLDGIAQVLGQIQNGGINEQGLNLWCSTRVVDGGCAAYRVITEFPIFSMLWNDLHPHVMAIPFVLLAVGMGVAALLDPPTADKTAVRYARLGAAAVAVGALFAINSWDYPTYLVLVLSAIVVAAVRSRTASWDTLVETAAIVPVSLLLYVPFLLTVHNSKSFGLHANSTALGDMLTVVGGLLIPVGLFVVWRGAAALTSGSRVGRVEELPLVDAIDYLPRGSGWWLAFGSLFLLFALPFRTELLYVLLLAAALWAFLAWIRGGDNRFLLAMLFAAATILVWALPFNTDIVYIILLAAAAYALVTKLGGDEPEMQAALLLVVVGVAVLFAGDIGYLRDNFDNTANYRMNTMFKLYYQAWILLAVATPFAVFAVGRALMRLRTRIPAALWFGAAGLLACGLALYPIEGVQSQSHTMAASNPGLDGLAYLQQTAPQEYAAVEWVRDHTNPTDVVAEAVGPTPAEPNCGSDYWVCDWTGNANSMSALTGRPTLIGWPGSHETLWQDAYVSDAAGQQAAALIAKRESDVDLLFSTADLTTASSLLRQYHVAYVYVGPFERGKYYTNPSNPGLAKFQTLCGTPVVQSGEVALYRVPPALRG